MSLNIKTNRNENKSSWLEDSEKPSIRYSMEYREGLTKDKGDERPYWDNNFDTDGTKRKYEIRNRRQ
jgi:hypothetical protein